MTAPSSPVPGAGALEAELARVAGRLAGLEAERRRREDRVREPLADRFAAADRCLARVTELKHHARVHREELARARGDRPRRVVPVRALLAVPAGLGLILLGAAGLDQDVGARVVAFSLMLGVVAFFAGAIPRD